MQTFLYHVKGDVKQFVFLSMDCEQQRRHPNGPEEGNPEGLQP